MVKKYDMEIDLYALKALPGIIFQSSKDFLQACP